MAFAIGQYKPTAETVQKIADSNRGKIRSAEQRKRLSTGMKGVPHHAARKEKIVTADGYVKVWDGNRQILEHRLVMEGALGRPLLPSPQETIHHKNGNRADNRLENLELRKGNHGPGQLYTA